ncbi:(d)CMP kinase [Mycoplasmopsis lipophila]|uniref:(d)CMP kinase n=1 Tax=Mycoplasmopsis lipophila TaxID=2117 RepID=UPI003872FBEB
MEKINKVNVAIDGPSGAGKSTVSIEIAKKLNYFYINTGSFYRALAYYFLKNKLDATNENDVDKVLNSIVISFDQKENIFLNDQNVSKYLRSDEISLAASIVAKNQKIRDFIVKTIQKTTNVQRGFIMDGRDTTFKIMPNAEVKIFLSASTEERAKRRSIQNKELGFKSDFEQVYKEIKERDFNDINRKNDPLHKTEDAIEIDCTFMSFEEVVNKIISIIKEKENLQ